MSVIFCVLTFQNRHCDTLVKDKLEACTLKSLAVSRRRDKVRI